MSFSFTHIVLTAPSEKIASVYSIQLEYLKSSVPLLNAAEIFCISDPDGFRIGSGGGTLNGLDFIIDKIGVEGFKNAKVLIVHSGGDSRRAPLYSLCGKAWTTLNGTTEGSNEIVNPLLLLITEISNFCVNLKFGSIVVASSDVLLHLCTDASASAIIAENSVLVICVPESTAVAKNHGVFVGEIPVSCPSYYSSPTNSYLQKPSESHMKLIGATFKKSTDDLTDFAFIDSGVVIFTGTAATQLISVLKDAAIHPYCTQHLKHHQNNSPKVLRFELYSELLLALKQVAQSESFTLQDYFNRIGYKDSEENELYHNAMSNLWNYLKDIPLYFIYVPAGCFEHLGTSEEVMDLLTVCLSRPNKSHTVDEKASQKQLKHLIFAKKYGLSSDVNSRVLAKLGSVNSLRSVVINSQIVDVAENSFQECVVEHSLLCSELSASLPSHCMVSHLSAVISSKMKISKVGTLVQQVFVKPPMQLLTNDSCFVLLLLNSQDNIKATVKSAVATFCTHSWSSILSASKCSQADIWSNPTEECTLWNAKMFPVCKSSLNSNSVDIFLNDGSYCSVANVGALTWFVGGSLDNSSASDIELWKKAMRVSLADLLSIGDAKQMLEWRLFCSAMYHSEYGMLHKDRRMLQDELLLNATVVYEGISLFKKTHRDWEDVCLLLWCVKLLMPNDDNNQVAAKALKKISCAEENLLSDFECLWIKILSLTNNCEVSLLAIHYLKRVIADTALLLMCSAMIDLLPEYAVESQPRLLLMIAWLLKDRPINRNWSGKQVNVSHTRAGNTNDLKSHGIVLIKEVWLNALQSKSNQSKSSLTLASYLESFAQSIVSSQIQFSLDQQSMNNSAESASELNRNVVYLAQSPVRIDIAGGWSDTPPICYELSGSVLNVSVLVDDKHPIKCATRLIAEPVIILRSYKSNENDEEDLEEDCVVCNTADCFKSISNADICSLLKAVVIVLNIMNTVGDESLANCLLRLYGGGIEVACISRLPAGSGMGGSSILAAAILRSIGDALHMDVTYNALMYLVSQVEQVLTTGGGWQDQMGAITGGFKFGHSPTSLPLRVDVSHYVPSKEFIGVFESRVYLVYTGQQRLAKNTLINALRRYALSPGHIGTVPELIEGAAKGFNKLQGASSGFDDISSIHAKIDELSCVLNNYWESKKEMASGSEPPHIKLIISHLRPVCEGISLCGAGAGGFGVVILKKDLTRDVLVQLVKEFNVNNATGKNEALSVHTVQLDLNGTTTTTIDVDSADDIPLYKYIV